MILAIGIVSLALLYLAWSRPLLGWGIAFICITATGISVDVGGARVRLEVLGLLFLILATRTRGLSRNRNGIILFFAAIYLAISLIASAILAPIPAQSIWIWVQVAIAIGSFFIIRSSNIDKMAFIYVGTKILTLVTTLSIVGAISLALGLPAVFHVGVEQDGRLIGLSIESNIFASQLIGWICLLFGCWKSIKLSAKISSVILIIGVILAGTRSAWLAMIIVLAVFLIRRFAANMFAHILVLISVAVILIVWPIVKHQSSDPTSLSWRLMNILDLESGTGAYRVDIWTTALEDIDSFQRGLIGTGMNSYSQYHPIDATGVYESYLSNVWLATYYDSGWIGLAFFSFMLLAILIYSSRKFSTLLVMGALMICATATNSIWFLYPWIYFAIASTPENPILNRRIMLPATSVKNIG